MSKSNMYWSVVDAETGMWVGMSQNGVLHLYQQPQICMSSLDRLTAVRRARLIENEFGRKTITKDW